MSEEEGEGSKSNFLLVILYCFNIHIYDIVIIHTAKMDIDTTTFSSGSIGKRQEATATTDGQTQTAPEHPNDTAARTTRFYGMQRLCSGVYTKYESILRENILIKGY